MGWIKFFYYGLGVFLFIRFCQMFGQDGIVIFVVAALLGAVIWGQKEILDKTEKELRESELMIRELRAKNTELTLKQ